jgi:hypothetical protein
VMLARRTRRGAQDAWGNGRFGDFLARDHLAVHPLDRLTLKIGQFTIAQRAVEVIADQAILLPHIAGPVQGLGVTISSRLRNLIQGSSSAIRYRQRRPRHEPRQEDSSRISNPFCHVCEVLDFLQEASSGFTINKCFR